MHFPSYLLSYLLIMRSYLILHEAILNGALSYLVVPGLPWQAFKSPFGTLFKGVSKGLRPGVHVMDTGETEAVWMPAADCDPAFCRATGNSLRATAGVFLATQKSFISYQLTY